MELFCFVDQIDQKELGNNLKEFSGYHLGYERHGAIMKSFALFIKTITLKENSKQASVEDLCVVHDKDYVLWLEKAWNLAHDSQDEDWFCSETETLKVSMHMHKLPEIYKSGSHAYKAAGYYTMDETTPVFQHTYRHAAISAQTAIAAAQNLKDHPDLLRCYVLTAHPGHHAKSNQYEGYCFFNNASLMIQNLLNENETKSKFQKIAVLDLDVHAGNGTQEIFYRSNQVLTISLHSSPTIEYPHREGFEDEKGEGEGKGYNLNLTFSKKVDLRTYMELLLVALKRIHEFHPDVLVIPFGADTYKGDVEVNSLAGGNLDVDDYQRLGQMISHSFGKKPILVTQEGGYCIEKVGLVVSSFLMGLCL